MRRHAKTLALTLLLCSGIGDVHAELKPGVFACRVERQTSVDGRPPEYITSNRISEDVDTTQFLLTITDPWTIFRREAASWCTLTSAGVKEDCVETVLRSQKSRCSRVSDKDDADTSNLLDECHGRYLALFEPDFLRAKYMISFPGDGDESVVFVDKETGDSFRLNDISLKFTAVDEEGARIKLRWGRCRKAAG